MTIGCTRCGATCEGDIILPQLAFKFEHNKGCGHGIGPLAVLPGHVKPKEKPKEEEKPETKEEIKVEELVEESKPRRSRHKSSTEKE